jgi:hypothetical protein
MKKTNSHRQKLLQRKRTKRNQSRKGRSYNPHKFDNGSNPVNIDPNSEKILL